MLRFIVSVLFLFLPCTLFLGGKLSDSTPDFAERAASSDVEAYASLYRSMQLEGVVNWKAFRQAVAGYYKIDNRKREVLTLIDFSRPSTAKRLFVFDMRERKVLFSSVVSHGKNSGDNYATSFSNEYGSYKSSLGFYLTESTYQGKNGYSLILNGLEKGINDRARERAIVMHGAAYADPSVVSRGGRLGRSFGCPAVPQKLSRPIIDAIKGGSVMYIYAETPDYLAHSSVLKDADGL
ncbi:murein L,D-transpeptidase catalytic domain family protein [Bacteroides intestinalis]|uniref:murein L,D-transpeptidase catalytic domain family protein n=1 Tax=Bacteroides intestinalis TaxID=329854 RepID=UPI0005CADB89|nr:murein L,D-transpeptidase catalytic domain family protein [Bacteroides intestinalis]